MILSLVRCRPEGRGGHWWRDAGSAWTVAAILAAGLCVVETPANASGADDEVVVGATRLPLSSGEGASPASPARPSQDEAEGASGAPTPLRAFTDDSGRPCRVYARHVTIDGAPVTGYATVCRLANGRWVLVQ